MKRAVLLLCAMLALSGCEALIDSGFKVAGYLVGQISKDDNK